MKNRRRLVPSCLARSVLHRATSRSRDLPRTVPITRSTADCLCEWLRFHGAVWTALLLLLAVPPATVFAERETEAESKAAGTEPATHLVEAGPFHVKVKLDGVFAPKETAEIALRPEEWSELTVLEAASHGEKVRRGGLLLALETEEIDQAIADLREENKLAGLSLKLAEEELKTAEATNPLDLAANARARRIAREDFEYYRQVGRPLSIESAEFALKSARQRLEYQEEEVRQLEKMYEADDLTEETEEIILKRARNALERARFSFKQAKLNHERTLKTELPRRDASMKESARRSEITAPKARLAIELGIEKQQLEFQQEKTAYARAEEKLEKLLADREAMTVTSPIDGIVYHGKFVDGKFSSSGSDGGKLRPGESVSAKKTIMTIVEPRPITVRFSVPEKQLENVRNGVKASIRPTGYSEIRLEGIVEHVSGIPESGGGFGARVTVADQDRAGPVMPGMTCKIELAAYQKENALAVPAAAVGTDPDDDQKHYVFLLDDEGKKRKRCVKVGKRNGGRIEILDGLSAGDEILEEYPNEE